MSAAAEISASSSPVLERIALIAAHRAADIAPTMKAIVTAKVATTTVTKTDLAKDAAARYQCPRPPQTSTSTRANSLAKRSTSWWKIR